MNRSSAGFHSAYISVGANLGDRLATCRKWVAHLVEANDIKLTAHSFYYKTAPRDYESQPWFVNAAFAVKTPLDPFALLDRLKQQEALAGQGEKAVRFGPRVLDLDLILYEDLVIHTKHLMVPHPRMHQRAFVLRPMCDIASGVIHPVSGLSVLDMLNDPGVAAQKCVLIKDEIFN